MTNVDGKRGCQMQRPSQDQTIKDEISKDYGCPQGEFNGAALFAASGSLCLIPLSSSLPLSIS